MSAQTGSPGPVILALDTATERLCAALVDGRETAAAPRLLRHDEPGGAAASARLVPALHALLQRAGLALPQVDAIAFVQGPGAFTGLRTACAVAQGLGWALARPLLPLDALMLVAEDTASPRPEGQLVAVAMDARMDEVYAGLYRWQQGRWAVAQAPALWALPALAAAWQHKRPAVLAGSALPAFAGRITWPQADSQQPQETDRAAALGRLAWAAWQAGAAVAAAEALPLYLRDKVAQTSAERQAAQAARLSSP